MAVFASSILFLLLLLFGFLFLRYQHPGEVQRSVTLLCVIAFYFQRADLFQRLDLQWPAQYTDVAQRTASLSSFNILDWAVEPNCIFVRPGENGTYLDFANSSQTYFGQVSLPFIMLVWFVFTQVPQLCFNLEEFGDKAVDGLTTIVSLFFMPYFKAWALVRVPCTF